MRKLKPFSYKQETGDTERFCDQEDPARSGLVSLPPFPRFSPIFRGMSIGIINSAEQGFRGTPFRFGLSTQFSGSHLKTVVTSGLVHSGNHFPQAAPSFPIFKRLQRDFPGVQWLRLHSSTAGGAGSIPGWETNIPHATQ